MHAAASSGSHVKYVTTTMPAVSYVLSSRQSGQSSYHHHQHKLASKLFYINGLRDQNHPAGLDVGTATASLVA